MAPYLPPQYALEGIKTEINLPLFATNSLGWHNVPQQSTQNALVLSHPQHGKIIAPTAPSPASGHWHFFATDLLVQRQGTLVGLLLTHQWTWQQITALYNNYLPSTKHALPFEPQHSPLHDPFKQTDKALEELQNFQETPLLPSHLYHLGIAPATYQPFTQLKTNHYQALFPLFKDLHNHPQGRLCSTIAYYFHAGDLQAQPQEGLPRGLALLYDHPVPDRLLLTDSPIEALAFKQLEAQHREKNKEAPTTLFVAPCGPLSASQQQDLQTLFQSALHNEQQVLLAFGKDKTAQQNHQQSAALLQAQNIPYSTANAPALNSSWRQTLQAQRHYALPQRAQHSLEHFLTAPHEHSLLQRIGVDKATTEALQTPLLASEQAILWGLYKDVASPDRTLVSTYTLYQNQQGLLQSHFQSGLPRGLTVLASNQTPQKIVVTQDPLEALRQRQALCNNLQLEHARAQLLAPQQPLPTKLQAAREAVESILFVSCCAPFTLEIYEELERLLHTAQQKEIPISLCLSPFMQKNFEQYASQMSMLSFVNEPPAPWKTTTSTQQVARAFLAPTSGQEQTEAATQTLARAHRQYS